jgi:hypothetical protein
MAQAFCILPERSRPKDMPQDICPMFVLACYKGSICAPHTYRNFSHIWKSRSKKSLLPTSSLQRKTKVLHFNSICTMFVFACYPSSICDKVWYSFAWGGTFLWTGVSDLSHIVSHVECLWDVMETNKRLSWESKYYLSRGLLCLAPLGILKTYLANILLDAY